MSCALLCFVPHVLWNLLNRWSMHMFDNKRCSVGRLDQFLMGLVAAARGVYMDMSHIGLSMCPHNLSWNGLRPNRTGLRSNPI